MANSTDIILRVRNEYLQRELEESKGMLEDFKQDSAKKFDFIKVAAVAAIAGMAIKKGFDLFSGMISDAQAAAESFAVLEAVVKSTGGASGLTANDIADLGDAMEKTTKFTGEMVQDAGAIVLGFGNIKGDNFIATTKVAADMATVLKTDLSSATTTVAKALQELDVAKLQKSGVSFTAQQEKEIESLKKMGDVAGAQRVILGQLQDTYGGAAEAAGKASFEPLMNQIGDIGERIGTALLPMLSKIGEVAGNVADWVTITLIPAFEETVTGIGVLLEENKDVVMGFLYKLGVGFANGMAIIQTVWSEAFTLLKIAGLGYVTTILAGFGNVVHFFTHIAPEAGKYFAENWRAILTDAGNLAIAVFTNMLANVSEFLAGMKRLLSGGSANFKFVALTEGFEATLTEMPKFTKRIPSELEQQLNKELAEAAKKVAGTFDKNLAANMELIGNITGHVKGSGDTQKEFGDIGGQTVDTSEEDAKREAEDVKRLEKVKALTEKIKEEKKKQDEKKEDERNKGTQVVSEDVEASYKRIQLAAASVTKEDDKDAKRLYAMEKELVALESNTEALKLSAKSNDKALPFKEVAKSNDKELPFKDVSLVTQQQSAEVKSGGSQLEILLDGILAATTKTAANTDALTPTLDRIANAIGKQKGGLA